MSRRGSKAGASARSPVGAQRMTRPRIRRRWLLVAGVVVAVVAVVATVAMLVRYPPRDIVPVSGEAGADDSGTAGLRALILATEANRAFYSSIGGDYDVHLHSWAAALSDAGVHVGVAASLERWEGEVLVLPHAYCLSQKERSQIRERVERGGGMLIAGPIGVRDEDTTWLGWEAMHALLGSSEICEFPKDQTHYLTIASKVAVGMEGMIGTTIPIPSTTPQWGLAGFSPAALWSDALGNPIGTDEQIFCAAATGYVGAGRIAWVGFEPNLPDGTSEARRARSALLRGLLLFCSSTPFVALGPS